MAWQIRTQSRNSTAITYLSRMQNRRVSFLLNRACEASASMDATTGNAFDLGLRVGQDEALWMRDNTPQETVFALTSATPNADSDSTRIDFEWRGIMSYLQDALVYGYKTAYSSTTLPWTWINTFQTRTGGDYGITQGTTTGTPPTRQRLIESDGTMLDEIIALSESSSGFDFSIGPDRKWNEWHTARGSSLGLTLEYGVNVLGYSYTESAEPGEIVTDARVIGPPGSTIQTVSDTTARTTYGRREAALSYFTEMENVTVTSSQLTNYGTAAIADRKAPLVIPSVQLVKNHPSVAWGSYWLGDTIRFRAAVGSYTTIDSTYRIVAIHVEIDENDNESVTLDLNKVIA